MRQISKEFIRDVQRIIGYDYIIGLIGLATQTVAGLMSAADKVIVDNLATTYAPIVHTHDDRYYTETEADALLALKLNSSAYTAADVLAKLVTVDGSGSGLDADLLDGNSGAFYLASSSYTAADVLAKLLTVDGAGSGIDADLLDGLSSSAFQPIDSDLTAIAALADPNADRILFWDDSLGAYTYLVPNTGISISGTNLDVATSSVTVQGIVELATTAEARTGTDTDRAVTPEGLQASLDAQVVQFDGAQSLTQDQKGVALLNIGSAWETIYNQAFSGVSSVNVTDLSAYRTIRIHLYVTVAEDTGIIMRTSTNNGSSYDAGASDYSYQSSYSQSTTVAASSGDYVGIFLYASDVGNAANEAASMKIGLFEFNQAKYMYALLEGANISSSGTGYLWQRFQQRKQATARNAFQVIPGSGTLTGYMTVEGIRG